MNEEEKRKQILKKVHTERNRQVEEEGWDAQHDDEHNPLEWVGLFSVYMGKIADGDWSPKSIKDCAIKIAAIAVALAEWCERKQG